MTPSPGIKYIRIRLPTQSILHKAVISNGLDLATLYSKSQKTENTVRDRSKTSNSAQNEPERPPYQSSATAPQQLLILLRYWVVSQEMHVGLIKAVEE